MPEVNGTKKPSIIHNDDGNHSKIIDLVSSDHHSDLRTSPIDADPIIVCEVLRQQNDALRQELHDIRREMDEITDQFRTEDAEEFKQIQAELELAAKNCRILQFKLRKAEKRYENLETEKLSVEDKLQQFIRENQRVRQLDEELLVAKEVSVRLHNELEKSEQSRIRGEKLNFVLKEQLDKVKELLDENLSKASHDDFRTWELTVYLYESLFREYMLNEELVCFNSEKSSKTFANSRSNDGNEQISDLIDSYQQKIALLHQQIATLKENLTDREKEISQLKQRSRSVDRNGHFDEDFANSQRFRRGVSVDGGGNLRDQLEASADEIRLLKNKLLRVEDELNNSLLEKETLLARLEEKTSIDWSPNVQVDLRLLTDQIEKFNVLAKDSRQDQRLINDLQQLLRSSRWSKDLSDEQNQNQENMKKVNDQLCSTLKQGNEILLLFEEKHESFEKIRQHLNNLTYDTNETCHLLEELETIRQQLDEKQQNSSHLQRIVEQMEKTSEEFQEKIQSLEKDLEQEKTINNELQQDNNRLSTVNAKQAQDLKHLDQLRQSILTFEKKLDQKQTRVNELSMKIIEKEDIIESKVKECQRHRLELRELETKYYNLGKQLEEQIVAMSKEIEKLNIEKEMLRLDLEALRLAQKNERNNPQKSSAENEIDRIKNECRQQIIEGELETFKLRLNQINREKEELLKINKDSERKYKDLQIRYDANEQSWNRLKNDMSEKQRKYDESIKLKSELQNAVDRLRQKLHDLETHSQDKQNKYSIEKQQWEIERIELLGKINELDEQLSKVHKRQRKDLETTWKKERQELQKQLQHSQQTLKEFQKQIAHRDAPNHLTEKINVLITENELLLNKIKELENVVDDVQLLKTEISRLREKNSSDWNYWRKQQNDLYEQLRQQQALKDAVLEKFERLRNQIKACDDSDQGIRDLSMGTISQTSFHADTKTSLSNYSRDTLMDEIELPHGTHDMRHTPIHDIVGAMDESTHQLQTSLIEQTFTAQQTVNTSLEEIATKIDRVEDHLFSYRRFMDFIRAKSEKSSSVVRDDSFTNIAHQANMSSASKRLASAPPENVVISSQRRSRMDATNSINDDEMLNSVSHIDTIKAESTPSTNQGKHRFFSLSRRFRFRTQSPEASHHETVPTSATVHFLDQDIDLETKEPTTKKSEQHGSKPSKGILKNLRHRSPFRFRSKDAVIIEQETSPPPTVTTTTSTTPASSKDPKSKAGTKGRGRMVELKKTPTKTTTSTKKNATETSTTTSANTATTINTAPSTSTTGSSASLVRRASGLKDLIHKFEATPPKPKRTSTDESVTKAVDIPDLLQNVEKDPSTTFNKNNSRNGTLNRQTASFDSTSSVISATDSMPNSRKQTSTARPLMINSNHDELPS